MIPAGYTIAEVYTVIRYIGGNEVYLCDKNGEEKVLKIARTPHNMKMLKAEFSKTQMDNVTQDESL